MLSTGELFNPSDASKVETTDKDKIKFTKTILFNQQNNYYRWD